MRLRTFYVIALLLPIVPIVAVPALGLGDAELTPALPAGATAALAYPKSWIRGLTAYLIVGAWLLLELRRRTPTEFGRLLWRAPLINAAASVLLLAPLVLVHGAAREMLAVNGPRIVLRLLIRLVTGFLYVALVAFVRDQLSEGGVLEGEG